MRALAVMIVLLAPVGLNPLYAQEQAKPSAHAAESKANSNVPATQKEPSISEHQKRHIQHRTGPGVDWDHRKAGRDWKYAPRDVDRKRPGDS